MHNLIWHINVSFYFSTLTESRYQDNHWSLFRSRSNKGVLWGASQTTSQADAQLRDLALYSQDCFCFRLTRWNFLEKGTFGSYLEHSWQSTGKQWRDFTQLTSSVPQMTYTMPPRVTSTPNDSTLEKTMSPLSRDWWVHKMFRRQCNARVTTGLLVQIEALSNSSVL